MNLLKEIRKSMFIRKAAGVLIAYYVRLVWLTSRWESYGLEHAQPAWDANTPVLGCFWHARLLMMMKVWYGQHKFHMLISSHPDGQIVARAAESHNIGWVAGSTNRNPLQAMRKILGTLKGGESVGITPDGPRGPRYVATLGAIQIAKSAGVDVYPVAYSTTRGIFLKSWDRFLLPLPFGRGVFVYGEPVRIKDSKLSLEELRQLLEDRINLVTRQADALCGRTGEADLPMGEGDERLA